MRNPVLVGITNSTLRETVDIQRTDTSALTVMMTNAGIVGYDKEHIRRAFVYPTRFDQAHVETPYGPSSPVLSGRRTIIRRCGLPCGCGPSDLGREFADSVGDAYTQSDYFRFMGITRPKKCWRSEVQTFGLGILTISRDYVFLDPIRSQLKSRGCASCSEGASTMSHDSPRFSTLWIIIWY